MATPLKQILDYDDYAAIPPDGNRYELIDGVGATWQPALDGEGDAVLTHPDRPDLTLRLADPWM